MQPIPLTMLVPSNVISAAGATVAPNDELTAPHLQVNTLAKDSNLQDDPTKTLIDVMNKMLGDEPTKSEWKYAQNVPEVGNKVVFAKYSGSEIKLDEKKYVIMSEKDILAVLEA